MKGLCEDNAARIANEQLASCAANSHEAIEHEYGREKQEKGRIQACETPRISAARWDTSTKSRASDDNAAESGHKRYQSLLAKRHMGE